MGHETPVHGLPEPNFAADDDALHPALLEPHLEAAGVPVEAALVHLSLHDVGQVIILGGAILPIVDYSRYARQQMFYGARVQKVLFWVSCWVEVWGVAVVMPLLQDFPSRLCDFLRADDDEDVTIVKIRHPNIKEL